MLEKTTKQIIYAPATLSEVGIVFSLSVCLSVYMSVCVCVSVCLSLCVSLSLCVFLQKKNWRTTVQKLMQFGFTRATTKAKNEQILVTFDVEL